MTNVKATLLLTLLLAWCLVALPHAYAQTKTPAAQKTAINWRAERILLHRQFGARTQELAAWCRKEGIEDQVSHTYGIYRNFHLDRQYIFLPTEKKMPSAAVKGVLATWLEKLNQVKIGPRRSATNPWPQKAEG